MQAKVSSTLPEAAANIVIRPASPEDLSPLMALEMATFATDRLTRRRMQHWIRAENGILLLAEQEGVLLGYCLALLHRGIRLVRLYSLAVSEEARGRGVGSLLVSRLETLAARRGKLFMRLEVAHDNLAAIKLYEKLGFVIFGTLEDYYEDHRNALRMQKRIRYPGESLRHRAVPWYRQTTGFTCGPASLMMVMAALDDSLQITQELELDIWREATTIFMTAGHGGSHPVGLALVAHARGFRARVIINKTEPLFLEGVRTPEKKQILTVVHNHFVAQAEQAGVPIIHSNITQKQVEEFLDDGALVLMLISTYRMDSRKAPHWVAITAIDDECLYVHDPDPTEIEQSSLDCQHLPILRSDFDRMSVFGRNQLRTAVIIEK
ncbi:MAG: GNAT family N-acetyltransferase/peptidase C39 family protein [Gammaproteobacteria bacterium]|jgi:ribosomal protein S18 acetylase RimI-like enzyme/predicted double-glycine peptidase